jgi:hypothetical protein
MKSICKKCGAEIKWCMMPNGAKIPLNIIPKTLFQVKEGIGEAIDVYESHFLTCRGSDVKKSFGSRILPTGWEVSP